MKLRVYIECSQCGEGSEVWVLGAWDIERVHHQCAAGESSYSVGGTELKEGAFVVEFDPRRVGF